MKADHARSEGARYERAAVRAYLRRQMARYKAVYDQEIYRIILNWILARQSRYDKAPGGLGKKTVAKKDTKIRRR